MPRSDEPVEPTAGRPSVGARSRDLPKGGAQVLARVTQELKNALEQEAVRTGRSISRVAEGWMEIGRDSAEQVQQALGGPEIAPTILAMAEAYREVSRREDSSRESLIEVWAYLADKMLPDPLPQSASNRRSAEALAASRSAFRIMAEVLGLTPEMQKIGEEDWLKAFFVIHTAIAEREINLSDAQLLAKLRRADITDALAATQKSAGEAINRNVLSMEATESYVTFMKSMANVAAAAMSELQELSDVRQRGKELADRVANMPTEYTPAQTKSAIASFLRASKGS